MYKIITIFCVALIAGFLFVRFVPSQEQVKREPIKVGVAFAQSGIADEWGEGALRVVQLYVDELNKNGGIQGKLVQLIVEDTRATNIGTVNAVTKLIQIDKVEVILGPTWADSFQGGLPLAENAKVVLMSADSSIDVAESDKNFDYFFSTFWPQASEIGGIVDYLSEHNFRRVAVVTDKDAFDVSMGQAFEQHAVKNQITITSHTELPITQTDFRTTIAKLRDEQPQAVVVFLQDPASMGPFAKQARELDLVAPIFSGSATQSPSLVQKFGAVLDGLYYSYPKTDTNQAYLALVDKYKTKYGGLPTIPTLPNAYNAVHAVVTVLQGGARTGEEIKDALYKLHTPGLGVKDLSFTPRGQVADVAFAVKTIRNGQFMDTKLVSRHHCYKVHSKRDTQCPF